MRQCSKCGTDLSFDLPTYGDENAKGTTVCADCASVPHIDALSLALRGQLESGEPVNERKIALSLLGLKAIRDRKTL